MDRIIRREAVEAVDSSARGTEERWQWQMPFVGLSSTGVFPILGFSLRHFTKAFMKSWWAYLSAGSYSDMSPTVLIVNQGRNILSTLR